MKQTETQKQLERFRDYVIKESRKNLTRLGKNSSKRLYNSIDGRVKANPNSFELEFVMEDYGVFQDKGVSGKFRKFDTPYNYKTKMPPPRALDKWIQRKGLTPRKNGKFAKRKSLQFVIARSIYRNGIKPSLFFTRPFEAGYKKLPQELIEKYGLDAVTMFNESIYLLENK